VKISGGSQLARDGKFTVDGCRILARQFRNRVGANQARAVARSDAAWSARLTRRRCCCRCRMIFCKWVPLAHGADPAGGPLGITRWGPTPMRTPQTPARSHWQGP